MTPKPAHSRLLMCVLLCTLPWAARAAEPAALPAVPLVTPTPAGVLLPYGAGYEQRLRATAVDTPQEVLPPTPAPQRADTPHGTSGPGGQGSGGGRGGSGRGGGRGR